MDCSRRARRENKITIPYSIVALLHSLQLYFLLKFLYSKYLLVFVFLPAQKTDQLAQTLMIPRTSVVIGFYAFLTKNRSQSFFMERLNLLPNIFMSMLFNRRNPKCVCCPSWSSWL